VSFDHWQIVAHRLAVGVEILQVFDFPKVATVLTAAGSTKRGCA
jgi:hypothetical protein